MLQALREVVGPAGDKMSEPVRKAVFQTLAGMLTFPDDITRSAAAGCLGALTRWLNKDQLHTLLSDQLLRQYFLTFDYFAYNNRLN